MRNNIKRQNGVTASGLVIILLILGFFVLMGLRLFPLYNEKFSVITAMNSISQKPNIASLPTRDIQNFFLKNMQIAGSSRFNSTNIKKHVIVKKDKKKDRYLHVAYEAKNKFIKDIYLTLVFDRQVKLDK